MSLTRCIALVMAILTTANAIPAVTVIPLANKCATFPHYNQTTDTTGAFYFVADSTGTDIDGNAAVNGFMEDRINGLGLGVGRVRLHGYLSSSSMNRTRS